MAVAPIHVRRIALREWLIITGLLLSLTAALIWFHRIDRINQSLYDRFMQSSPLPARDDIVLVAIDDYSLAELGKWPWSRHYHAQLLQQLSAAKPKAIGIDVLFTEPDSDTQNQHQNSDGSGDGQTDALLANAIKANHHVVLPITVANAGKGLSPALPIPVLAEASQQLGHINLEHDADGIVRSVFLREGMNGQWWPHFSLALKELASPIPNTRLVRRESLPGIHAPDNQRATSTSDGVWQRDYQMHIRFYGGNGTFKSVPYVAVLRGEVPAEFFRDKYVLVGATALGMADAFPTPVSDNEGVLSGVEINATILANLLDHNSITIVPKSWEIATCLLPVLLALLAYLLLSPRWALLITGVLLLGVLAFSHLALKHGYWLPPAAALTSLLLAYPLWSWRRLEAAIRYLGEEFILLDREPHLLPELATDAMEKTQTPRRKWLWNAMPDKLEQRINAMQSAARRVRDLRQFVSDSLHSLPDATLVTTTDGHVLLVNAAANHYFSALSVATVTDTLAPYLFAQMKPVHTMGMGGNATFSWWDLLDLKQRVLMSRGIEAQDAAGRDILIKSAPCFAGSGELSGWIISLINITAIRAAERSRDETLNFISHDMRAPQASILALLELQKDASTAIPQAEFLQRIENASHITLGLADNFVHLARAESQTYRLEQLDLQDLLLDATEGLWTQAKSKNIRIVTHTPEHDYPVHADRSLMTRALTNLLSNAIKYSRPETTITCTLTLSPEWEQPCVICSIADQGIGIAAGDQSRLFQRYQRFGSDQGKNDGVGLGMVFVKTVIDRHRGSISFSSVLNQGTTFEIKLPLHRV